ncbi:MAG: putative quinol monooxygenase [Acidimicrobiales bacterium]|jgi:quinol monooxygenase YgiN
MLTVIARYKAQTGMGDLVATTLAKHVAATRTEPGCLQFVAYRSQKDPDQFVLYEQYVDDAAFEAHRQTPHFHSYVEGIIVPLLSERQADRYDEVDPG